MDSVLDLFGQIVRRDHCKESGVEDLVLYCAIIDSVDRAYRILDEEVDRIVIEGMNDVLIPTFGVGFRDVLAQFQKVELKCVNN